jgi:hypothetical protein
MKWLSGGDIRLREVPIRTLFLKDDYVLLRTTEVHSRKLYAGDRMLSLQIIAPGAESPDPEVFFGSAQIFSLIEGLQDILQFLEEQPSPDRSKSPFVNFIGMYFRYLLSTKQKEVDVIFDFGAGKFTIAAFYNRYSGEAFIRLMMGHLMDTREAVFDPRMLKEFYDTVLYELRFIGAFPLRKHD